MGTPQYTLNSSKLWQSQGTEGVKAGADPGVAPGARPPLTTKNEAPAPKFYKTEAPEWQF